MLTDDCVTLSVLLLICVTSQTALPFVTFFCLSRKLQLCRVRVFPIEHTKASDHLFFQCSCDSMPFSVSIFSNLLQDSGEMFPITEENMQLPLGKN